MVKRERVTVGLTAGTTVTRTPVGVLAVSGVMAPSTTEAQKNVVEVGEIGNLAVVFESTMGRPKAINPVQSEVELV
jgi:hypothetical protein